jgi:cytoskeletal protein RodZ
MVMLSKSKNSKKLIILSLVILVLTSLGVLFAMSKQPTKTTSEPLTKENNHVDNEKQPITNSDSGTADKTLPPSSTSSGSSAPEKFSITRAEVSGDYLRVSAIINNPSTGSCILKLEKQGYDAVSETSAIIVGPNYYTCDGFRVPLSKLPAHGEWTVSVTHQLGGQTTISDVKNVVIP